MGSARCEAGQNVSIGSIDVMEVTTIYGESLTQQEEPTPRLRWMRHSPLPEHRTLQQLWLITTWKDGRPHDRREEWRELPSEYQY